MSDQYERNRRLAWQEFATKAGFPAHDDIEHGGGGRNHWQLVFYAGYDAHHADKLKEILEE